MEFGIFDHLDASGLPLAEHYETRLKLAELYDRTDFRAYHLAEHHATTLGMAPSPSIFLAALSQRTRRLRFGPLIYILPLYHPLRLVEEICMLDQMSRGRLELGVGRGISPFELGYFGLDPKESQPRYEEALELILAALGKNRIDFAGKFYRLRDVPLELDTVQKPHPPLWYGAINPDSAAWLARHGINLVSHVDAPKMREITERYRAEWRAGPHRDKRLGRMGLGRHIVIAPSRDEALDVARRAYRRWHDSFTRLWRLHGSKPTSAYYPESFDALAETGVGIAGTPAEVRDRVLAEIETSGTNYWISRFAFGDLSFEESKRSLALFVEHVMPAARRLAAAA